MVLNVYTGLKQYQEVGGNLVERIKSMGLYEVFQPLDEEYGDDMETFNHVLFYLLNCYSRNSPFVIIEREWSEIKLVAAEDAGIDVKSELFFDLTELTNTNFTRAIRRYLDYQGGKAHKHLMMLKEQYDQFVNSAIENIKGDDEKINWDQKFKNGGYATKLYQQIAEWEQRIEVDNVPLKRPLEEFKEVETKKDNAKKFSLRPEDNLE